MTTQTRRNVTTIPASINRFTSTPLYEQNKRRTAGYARVSTDSEEQATSYARVSTDSEEQATSYEAQVDYYTSYIKIRNDWEFVTVYTDEGISATNTKHREGFKRMIADALDGKIDLIVTKSVSRFARNTVDSLTTVRKLKEKGIEIYFEKENIWTLDSKGELLITIMSSLAQEESRSISENVTWGQRKRFADGKVTVPFAQFLGFDKGEDGNLVVNETEAKVVKKIFAMFLQGMTPYGIAKQLTEENISTPGKKKKWSARTVKAILSNEKYKGDALLQKSYTLDFLTKIKKINEGEIPQYYVENNHEAIIEPALFDMVQVEINKRETGKNRHSGVHIFSGKIKCSECGSFYGSKVWHSNSKYKRTIWQCNHKFKNDEKCKTPHLDEEQIKKLFVLAVNKLLDDKEEIIKNIILVRSSLFDTQKLERQQLEHQNEMTIVAELIQKCVEENATKALNQEEYKRKYEGLVSRYNEAKIGYENIVDKLADMKARGQKLEVFLQELEKQAGAVKEFDERLWGGLLESVIVSEVVSFKFKCGTEIMV